MNHLNHVNHSLKFIKNFIYFFFGFGFGFGFGFFAWETLGAENNPNPKPKTSYNWDQCVELTQQRNAELAGHAANIEAKQYLEKARRGDFLPKFSASFGYEKKQEKLFDQKSQSDFSTSLNGSLNLFSGFQNTTVQKQAEGQTTLAELNFKVIKARISYELKSAFEGLSYAKEYTRLTKDIMRRREENLNLVDLRFQGGLENKGSVLLSKAYLAQAQFEYLQASNVLVGEKFKLMKIMGLINPEGEALTVESWDIEGNIPLETPPATLPNFHQLVQAVPEYQLAKAEEESAELAVTSAKSNFYPKLDLQSSVSQSGKEFFSDQRQQWSLGLSLTLPLFEGGTDYYQLKSEVANWAKEKSERVSATQGLQSQLREAYSLSLEAHAKLQADQIFRDAALVRAEIARKKYNNGLLSFEDWDAIENDLISRQKAYLKSKKDRVIAEAFWEKSLGQGVIQ